MQKAGISHTENKKGISTFEIRLKYLYRRSVINEQVLELLIQPEPHRQS